MKELHILCGFSTSPTSNLLPTPVSYEVVQAYESVTGTNQQSMAPFVPKSSVSYKDVSTISKLIDKRSLN